MKKVLILTWCNTSTNFGELLQAYALQKVVYKLGFYPITVSYLDYSRRKNNKKNSIYCETWISKFGFQEFIKKNMFPVIQCSSRIEVERIAWYCDIYLCGSDQIWNPQEIDATNIYALDFGDSYKRKIAYAPSMAIDKETRENRTKIQFLVKAIEKIDYISVREETTKTLLEKYIQKSIQVVLDPTLLLRTNSWNKCVGRRKVKGSYILCYVLGHIKPYVSFIHQIADSINVDRIVYIDLIKNEIFDETKVIKNVSPKSFLALIKYANFIFTDSYHGTLFSINFQKNFYVGRREYNHRSLVKDTRIEDILERTHLLNRIVSKEQKGITGISREEWVSVAEILAKERRQSIAFLKKSLHEVE